MGFNEIADAERDLALLVAEELSSEDDDLAARRDLSVELRSASNEVKRQPFEPFVLRMSNGEIHEVRHPECVAVGKTRIAVSFPEQDRFVHLSLTHVNAIEALQTTLQIDPTYTPARVALDSTEKNPTK